MCSVCGENTPRDLLAMETSGAAAAAEVVDVDDAPADSRGAAAGSENMVDNEACACIKDVNPRFIFERKKNTYPTFLLFLKPPNAAPHHHGPFSLTWPPVNTKLPVLLRSSFVQHSRQRQKLS